MDADWVIRVEAAKLANDHNDNQRDRESWMKAYRFFMTVLKGEHDGDALGISKEG